MADSPRNAKRGGTKVEKSNDSGKAHKVSAKHVIDEIDFAILRHLQENSNRTYASISRALKKDGFEIQGPAVGNRIDTLRQRGYIAKECAIVDYKKFGAGQMYLMLAKVPDKSGQNVQNFIEAASEIWDIMEVHETMGQYDYLLKVLVSELKEATTISLKLAKLGAVIETLSVNETMKSTTALRIPRS
jgi:DNA-binding Lrp family transcriptional regulator